MNNPDSPFVWLLLAVLCAFFAACGEVVEADEKPQSIAGCDGVKLRKNPADTGKSGAWEVGARTIQISGLTVEVWYPAAAGSAVGQSPKTWDLRQWLPPSERAKVPAGKVVQTCACYPDLAPDANHGPYPVVVFIHGTAGFRTQSLALMQHWASRGFIVLAADHPRIMLSDALQLNLGSDQPGDARKLLAAVTSGDDALGFLAGLMDMQQLAVAGHSAGGMALSKLGDVPGVRVLIPMAARGVDPAHPVTSTLVLGGEEDGTVKFEEQQKGYDESPKAKRLVGLHKAGHLAFSDLCALGADGQGIFEIAKTYKVSFPPGTEGLFEKLAKDGCGADQLSPQEGWTATNEVTSLVLEETLHCRPATTDPLAGLDAKNSAVSVYAASLW